MHPSLCGVLCLRWRWSARGRHEAILDRHHTDRRAPEARSKGNTMTTTSSRRRTTAVAACALLALIGVASCSSKDDDDTSAATDDATSAVDTDTTTDSAAEATDGAATDTTAPPVEDALGDPNPATDTPITIGYVTDGADAAFGSDEDTIAMYEATVQYANEYLGGINGHAIEVEHCSTGNTPTGATQCAVDLTTAGVDAMVVPVTAQDATLFAGLAGSGIPYFTVTSASVIGAPEAFVMANPISAIATPGLIALEQGVDKVGFIIVDVPAATGPITAIATPVYESLGVELQVVPISPSTPDMTPQLQEAISGGAELFSIAGTEDFTISAVNGLNQLGFTGTVMLSDPPPTVLDALTSLDNLVGQGSRTDDPADPDVALMTAVAERYTDVEDPATEALAFTAVLGFVRALTGASDALDAATITAALSSMSEVEMPLGAGITFQCGTAPVAWAPSLCSLGVLQWTYDAGGQRQGFGVVDVPAEVLALG